MQCIRLITHFQIKLIWLQKLYNQLKLISTHQRIIYVGVLHCILYNVANMMICFTCKVKLFTNLSSISNVNGPAPVYESRYSTISTALQLFIVPWGRTSNNLQPKECTNRCSSCVKFLNISLVRKSAIYSFMIKTCHRCKIKRFSFSFA